MREDMFKVIVERPRLVNSNPYSRDGRKYRNSEDAPVRLGMKRGYGKEKWLNENLAPLRRFLESQVNRPWDKVYSEIRAGIDGRSTVKQHVLQHIKDFVALDTRWVETAEGGKVVVRRQFSGRVEEPLDESRFQLFVHPRTGILLRNRHYVLRAVRYKAERPKLSQEQARVRKILNYWEQLHQIDGIWYHVELAVLPAPRLQGHERKVVYDACWDEVRKEWVSREHGHLTTPRGQPSNMRMYGDPFMYARAKWQIGRRELRKHGFVCG